MKRIGGASRFVGWPQGAKKRSSTLAAGHAPKCRDYRPDINYFCSDCGYEGVIPAKRKGQLP